MRSCIKACIVVALLVFCFGCVAQKKQCTGAQAQACPPVEKKASCIQKVDNFLVILDTSETMQANNKLQQAKGIVAAMNQSIPDIKLNGGMRVFGRGYMLFSIGQTDLLYGMTSYEKQGLAHALAKVDLAMGDSPMAKALNKATEDLRAVSGRSAVILVSDGKPTDQGVLEAVENLKKTYGDNVCMYTILVGDCYDGEKLLEKIATIGGCGFSVNAADIATCDAMATFVKKVFFVEKAPAEKMEKMIINAVLFDFDSNVVKPEAAIVLKEAAGTLKQGSQDVVVEGHTCSMGPEDYNMGLSQRRADAVKEFLMGLGVEASRLTAKGVGEAEPVADNTTQDGRERNRRVEFEVMR